MDYYPISTADKCSFHIVQPSGAADARRYPSSGEFTNWNHVAWTAAQGQKVVSAYFLSEQILPFGFCKQC